MNGTQYHSFDTNKDILNTEIGSEYYEATSNRYAIQTAFKAMKLLYLSKNQKLPPPNKINELFEEVKDCLSYE